MAAGTAGGLRMGRRWSAAGVAALSLISLLPATASALLFWTLLGSPLTATAHQSTTFTLTATNFDLLTELGCLEVDLPPSFVIEAAGTPNASNGDPWSSTVSGGAVVVYSLSGGGRLETSESVTFTIRARPTAAGAHTWPNHAHRQQDCSGTDQIGVPLAITVLPGPAPTPTPPRSPTPSPTSNLTSSPTPSQISSVPVPSVPLPSLPLPSLPLPSLPLPSEPVPSLPVPTPLTGGSPSATPSPTASALESRESMAVDDTPTPAVVGPRRPGSSPSGQPPSAGGAPGALQLAPEGDDGFDGLGAGIGVIDLLGDAHVWFVPAAAIGVPGLLLIVWVALQTAGVLAWLPAVRRIRGDERERRRPARR